MAGGSPGPHPGGGWRVWPGGVPRPTLGWWLGGSRSRPRRVYPSMHWGRHPPSRRLLLRAVRILLECILVNFGITFRIPLRWRTYLWEIMSMWWLWVPSLALKSLCRDTDFSLVISTKLCYSAFCWWQYNYSLFVNTLIGQITSRTFCICWFLIELFDF